MDENNRETGSERTLVEMKISGLGNMVGDPQTMVILMVPVDDDIYKGPEGHPMVFPVPVPASIAPIYFMRITRHFRGLPLSDDLIPLYEDLTESELKAFHIYMGRHTMHSYMIYQDRMGEENSFATPLANGILTATLNDLPILLEQKLLLKAASTIKINYMNDGEVIRKQQKQNHPKTYYELVTNLIMDDQRPEDQDSETVQDAINALSEQQKQELTQLALERESYEWAARLNKEEEKGGDKTDE